jgi:hypothetical protein
MGQGSMLIFGGFASEGGGAGSGAASADGKRASRRGGDAKRGASSSGRSGSYSNAIYAFDTERHAWSMPTVHLAAGGTPPLARLGASATALHTHAVMLFGGSHKGSPCACLDVLHASADLARADATLRVEQPHTSGVPPPPRYGHVAALLGHTDVVIAGGAGGADGRQILGDVALLHAAQMRWVVLEVCTQALEPAGGEQVGAELLV